MLKNISRVSIGLAGILSVATLLVPSFYAPDSTSATDCANSPCNTTFQVNVKESLAVSITLPSTWASGTPTATSDTGFLRNTITLDVTSNNATGFTASMYASSTDLVNTSKSTATLPTLDASTVKSAFPSNHWGYSLNTTGDVAGADCTGHTVDNHTCTYNGKVYNENTAGNNDSYYHAVPTSAAPATVLTGVGATSGTRDIYFGTKASIAQPSGTYAGTVVINVVTGTVNDGYTTPQAAPVNPVTPASDTANDGVATYANGKTVYTTTTPTTTTTQISDGNTTGSYANPQGVTESSYTSNVSDSSPLAIGLASAAAIAAVSGGVFFILAKRKKDDDEEE